MGKKNRKYLNFVHLLPCSICGMNPVEAHHKREGVGMGLKADDADAYPLCVEHHRGQSGFHGMGRRAWERAYGSESSHVEKTQKIIKAVYGLSPDD